MPKAPQNDGAKKASSNNLCRYLYTNLCRYLYTTLSFPLWIWKGKGEEIERKGFFIVENIAKNINLSTVKWHCQEDRFDVIDDEPDTTTKDCQHCIHFDEFLAFDVVDKETGEDVGYCRYNNDVTHPNDLAVDICDVDIWEGK